MKSLLKGVKVIAVVMVLVACDISGGGDDGGAVSPVSTIEFRIDDRSDATMDTIFGSGNLSSVFISFFVELNADLHYTSIDSLQVENPLGLTWIYDSAELADRWSSSSNAFFLFNLYASSYPHLVTLGEWTVRVTQEGVTFTETVTLVADGDPAQNSGSIRSKTGTGTTSEILLVPSAVSATESSGDVTVSFTLSDSRIDDVYVWFYSVDGTYLGVSERLEADLGETLDRSGATNNIAITLSSETNIAAGDHGSVAQLAVVAYASYSTIVGGEYRSIAHTSVP